MNYPRETCSEQAGIWKLSSSSRKSPRMFSLKEPFKPLSLKTNKQTNSKHTNNRGLKCYFLKFYLIIEKMCHMRSIGLVTIYFIDCVHTEVFLKMCNTS